ncbi:regulation of enolase protein 1 (concanavalin A-like superfamily) [Kribbella sp. VKM Ac-2527]|uniref:Regulation of enolase protein 1 (Concanavalin A-like superfamily) n=1 Tax=Kribbella caucasensis TaxID=2512215 RepID=A0A4R6JDB0_9ACTN|nr:ABC transporter permease subunit [Kribbella sp. VKM Ac-2527]TDO33804.1 regulation of enolase protein 1 (concanavalin A-like superfamily) [Kribbella sp. VKM Ac-2527]
MTTFLRVLRGEWTKFRSVRSTALCLFAAIAVTVLLELLGSTAGSTDANEQPTYSDQAFFVHKPLSGDGTLVARVVSQPDDNEWAKAGLLVKAGLTPGSPYAAVMVTPGHGIRMQAMFDTDLAGVTTTAPRWLKLTRTGDTITGYESADGQSWQQVGTVTVSLPQDAEIGLFVASPPEYVIKRTGGGTAVSVESSIGRAIFDSVTVTGAEAAPDWAGQNLSSGPSKENPYVGAGAGLERSGGTFTLAGSGDIAGYGIASWRSPGDDDVVMLSLFGVRLGLIAIIALGVLFMTAEYRTGLIRTTLAASPRRGHVLAAKAVVLAGAVFVAGLIASVSAFLLAQPGMHDGGYNPPAYPHVSLTDGDVVRAVIGTAIYLALIALFSLGIAVVWRRTTGVIVFVIALVVLPQIIVPAISPEADVWVSRLTPLAGLAVQQSVESGQVIGPWAGLGVMCAYAVAALGLAYWQLVRRDA